MQFSFENCLGKIKRKINAPYRPLAQYCNRFHEENCLQNKLTTKLNEFEVLKKNGDEILELKYKETILSLTFPNNMARLNDERIVQIENIFFSEENILSVQGRIVNIIKSVYTYPSNSNVTKIWEIQSQPSTRSVTVPIKQIESKIVHLRLNFLEQKPERVFALSLLHQ